MNFRRGAPEGEKLKNASECSLPRGRRGVRGPLGFPAHDRGKSTREQTDFVDIPRGPGAVEL